MISDELFLRSDSVGWLLLAPAVWFLIGGLDRARWLRLGRAIGPRARALSSEWDPRQRRGRRVLATTGLLLALVAVLQPVWGEGLRKMEQRGVDILVCLDVSRSMLARDVAPSRLSHAKGEVRRLAERIHGDRMGLVAFAGESRLKVPLTQDMETFADLVDQADPLDVSKGGTDLGSALETALFALEGGTGDHEVVVLVTDGEDLEQQGLRVARRCRDRGLRVHCVGLGSPRGSKIAVEKEGGETFLRDRAGTEVVSALDVSGLEQIARTTGGVFIDGSQRPLPLLELYEKRIRPMARKTFEDEKRRERTNRFQWPLLAAFLLWIVELGITDRKRR